MNATKTLLAAFVTCTVCAAGCADDEQTGAANHTDTRSVHAFECNTQEAMTDGVRHSVRFSVVGLDSAEFDEDFVWPEQDDGSDCPDCPVKVQPQDSPLMSLNENAVIYREDGKLILAGDADGFYWVDMVMYQNSGFTKGYVRIEDGGGYVDEYYGKVTCKVTEVTGQPGEQPDITPLVGFYQNYDYEWEGENAPLLVAIYPPSADLPAGYAGHVDLATFGENDDITKLTQGWLKIEGQDGSYELQAVDENGEPLTASAWTYLDRKLTVEGVEMYHMNRLDDPKWVKQCYGLQVVEYEFEEGFTPYEYPSVDVERNEDGTYNVDFGMACYDSDEADITVNESDNGDFEAVVVTDYSTYVLRVPAGTPSRGQVLFGDSYDQLEVMANLGCYQ